MKKMKKIEPAKKSAIADFLAGSKITGSETKNLPF